MTYGRSMQHAVVDVADGALEVRVVGDGPLVVLVPSLGRGAADFAHLAGRLAGAGFRAACPEPRGIGATTAPLDGLTMSVLADDVAAVIAALGGGADRPAVVIGHAFGNRVARMTATDHPQLVRGVGLLACGGAVPPSAEAARALRSVFDESLTPEEHLAHVGTAFFAPGNDPTVWADGWYPIVAYFQAQATKTQPVEHWWAAGSAPVLVVQPSDDAIAPAANAHDIVDRLGDRATLVAAPGAGHALLPEQPALVADAVIGWLSRLVG